MSARFLHLRVRASPVINLMSAGRTVLRGRRAAHARVLVSLASIYTSIFIETLTSTPEYRSSSTCSVERGDGGAGLMCE